MLTATDKQSASQSFAVLQIDNLQMAFPQDQIDSVHLLSDMDTQISTVANIGWITKNKQVWPIYAISNSLLLFASLPPQRRFCVCFHPVAGQHYIGLAVDAIVSLQLKDSIVVQTLPDCISNPQSPVSQVIKNENQLVFISDADYLYRYIEYRESHR